MCRSEPCSRSFLFSFSSLKDREQGSLQHEKIRSLRAWQKVRERGSLQREKIRSLRAWQKDRERGSLQQEKIGIMLA